LRLLFQGLRIFPESVWKVLGTAFEAIQAGVVMSLVSAALSPWIRYRADYFTVSLQRTGSTAIALNVITVRTRPVYYVFNHLFALLFPRSLGGLSIDFELR
jgi:hypothetical protein